MDNIQILLVKQLIQPVRKTLTSKPFRARTNYRVYDVSLHSRRYMYTIRAVGLTEHKMNMLLIFGSHCSAYSTYRTRRATILLTKSTNCM